MKSIIALAFGSLIHIGALVLAIFSWVRATHLSLPIPTLAPLLATALPILNFILLFSSSPTTTTTDAKPSSRRLLPIDPFTLLFILDTLLITLASSQLPAATLLCSLETQWRSRFQSKDARAIRSIQDRLNCCGLRSARDEAWPFPDRDHGADACTVASGGRQMVGCLRGLQREMRLLLAWMIVVGACSLLIKFVVVVLCAARYRPGGRPFGIPVGSSSSSSSAPLPDEGVRPRSLTHRRRQQQIEQSSLENQPIEDAPLYRDDDDLEPEQEGEHDLDRHGSTNSQASSSSSSNHHTRPEERALGIV